MKKATHVFVGHGEYPIPPEGWGAVEHVIWQLATRLEKRGIPVKIVNRKRFRATLEVLQLSLAGEADVVYCAAEKPVRMLAWLARWRKFLLISASHHPFSAGFDSDSDKKTLRRIHHAPYHFVLRDETIPAIVARNPNAKCVVLPNGVETSEYKTKPLGNGRAVYLGRIQPRKRQNEAALLLQGSGVECDFVGPLMEDVEMSDELRTRLAGSWNRTEVYERLCEYSCLLLISRSEGQPLVVLEAMAAGLPVVVTPECAANLDKSKPFIFVAKSDEEVPDLVRQAIAIRDVQTKEIRQYVESNFDYEVLVEKYLQQVGIWRPDR